MTGIEGLGDLVAVRRGAQGGMRWTSCTSGLRSATRPLAGCVADTARLLRQRRMHLPAKREGIYPALIMANGARAEGIEANLFFTFFGLDAVTKKRHEHIKVATVGNPGLHLATLVGSLPGMPGLMTS